MLGAASQNKAFDSRGCIASRFELRQDEQNHPRTSPFSHWKHPFTQGRCLFFHLALFLDPVDQAPQSFIQVLWVAFRFVQLLRSRGPTASHMTSFINRHWYQECREKEFTIDGLGQDLMKFQGWTRGWNRS